MHTHQWYTERPIRRFTLIKGYWDHIRKKLQFIHFEKTRQENLFSVFRFAFLGLFNIITCMYVHLCVIVLPSIDGFHVWKRSRFIRAYLRWQSCRLERTNTHVQHTHVHISCLTVWLPVSLKKARDSTALMILYNAIKKWKRRLKDRKNEHTALFLLNGLEALQQFSFRNTLGVFVV